VRSIPGMFLICLGGVVSGCGSPVSPAPTQPDVSRASRSDRSSPAIDWTMLARPLQLPRLAAGDACPRSSGRQVSSAFGTAFGDGPVYPVFGSSDALIEPVAIDGPFRSKVLWVGSSSYQGPALIRGAQLDGSGVVEFATEGSASTSDLRLLVAGATSEGEEPGWREWPSYTVVPGSGCYAYQVDGTTFGLVIVFAARRAG
jgi:hypothetical protein